MNTPRPDHDDLRDAFESLVREGANRPLGDTDRVSGLTMQRFSQGGQRAAKNLLTKALRALDGGDETRARTFVERAARLPFDRHEEAVPAAVEAHMMLYMLVCDAMEASAEDDHRWLDAALHVLDEADADSRSQMADPLLTVAKEGQCTPEEQRRIRRATDGVAPAPDAWDLRLEEPELVAWLLVVLETCRRYRDALAALG